MAKELIFIADDFGKSNAINEAIVYAHHLGHLTGASLMMAQSSTEAAVALARAHRTLQIGWHLHLNDSLPATITHWPWGTSPARAGWSIGISRQARELMHREVARQWELFRQTGLECRFINSHHHLHAHPFVYQAMLDVVGHPFAGWIRLGQPRALRSTRVSPLWTMLGRIYLDRRRKTSVWRSTDTLWGIDRLSCMEARAIENVIASLPDGFHEFMFHPRTLSCPDTQCLLQLKSSLAQS